MSKESSQYNKFKARSRLVTETTKQLGSSLYWATKQRTSEKQGVNLVASHRRNSGIGFFSGIISELAQAAGQVVENFDFDEANEIQKSSRLLCGNSVAVISPGQLPFAQILYPRVFSAKRFRAAVIFWDVNKIPRRMGLGFKLLDELWIPSIQSAETFSNQFDIPVRVLRTPVVQLKGGTVGSMRKSLGIADEFLVAYQFDMGSSAMRKNPWAAVAAYKLAFPKENSGARLVLKSSRANETSPEWLSLKAMCDQRRDIQLINDFWSEESIASLYLDIDCYLSTHRSEGYGLTVAHALASDKYVVATDFGATRDFMPQEYSARIPYQLVKIGKNPVYPSDASWAEPSVEAAAALLLNAFSDPEGTKSKGIRAGQRVRAEYSIDRSVDEFAQLLRPE
jgi:glycosyltransferase involved in cell wall biosynthesis